MTTRREFIRRTALAGLAGTVLFPSFKTAAANEAAPLQPIKLGIIADIHRDLTPDVEERLEAFMNQVEKEKPDLIISLGDFAHAIPANESFRDRFSSSKVPAYHVLGNHEMDRVSKSEAAAFLKMPSPFYSFDLGGYHFVMLDPNYIYSGGKFIDYEKSNYFKHGSKVSYINDDQCDWLKSDLQKTTLPTFLFSHQSLMHIDGGIPNRVYVQQLLEDENTRVGYKKVLGYFSGHHHDDFYRRVNGIDYFRLNSVSYDWHAQKIPGRYPEELAKRYPHLDNMAMYKDPLYSFVTIDTTGLLTLQGVQSHFTGNPPPGPDSKSVRYGRERSASISDRKVVLR